MLLLSVVGAVLREKYTKNRTRYGTYVYLKMNQGLIQKPRGIVVSTLGEKKLLAPATRSTLLGWRPDLDDRVRTAFPCKSFRFCPNGARTKRYDRKQTKFSQT